MIRYKKDTNNIVTLTLDMSGRTVNVINHEIVQAFIPVVEHLKKEKERGELSGIIITSAKKTFLAGGDLEYLYQDLTADEIFNFSQQLQNFFRDLERPGVPVVAAMNGSALGTGFELALACHHRIVVDAPKTRIGHPEVKLGLMPGSGGIIRMMWLLGIEKTYQILIREKAYRPKKALKIGIIDALAKDEADMMEQAHTWLLAQKEGRRPWDQEGGRIPHGTARHPEMSQKIQALSAMMIRDGKANFPVYRTILSVLTEGSMVDFDTACRIESRYYTNLLMGKVSRNMIKAFWFDQNAIKSGANRPKGYGLFRPKKVGIIGAGRMGSGIAFRCLRQGMEVIVKDVSKSVAERAREYVKQELENRIKIERVTEAERDEHLSRIKTTDVSADFESCDIVIEAVFENEMVKAKVLREAEEYMDDYSIFGTNTVSIPITALGKRANRPANLVGLHFFSPADEVPLVEIVRGEQTSDETVARAFDFAKKILKTPIIVKDSWGFYASRVQNTYILEGIQMLQEGYPAALIENVGRQAGMPKGALALADDSSFELVLRYEELAAQHYGPKYIQHPAVTVLQIMLNELERKGAVKKAGFYTYEGEERRLWKELVDHFPVREQDYPVDQIKERFLFVQVLEAVWCLQEGIIQTIPEANLGSIHGWGFPSFKGGVIQFVNDYGVDEFVNQCKIYEATYGPRFKVPKMLVNMKKGQAVFV